MEELELLGLYRNLIRAPHTVRTIRASVLASYWYCSEKARLQALGVQEANAGQFARIGSIIHKNILTARNPSPLEEEFAEALKPFYKTGEDGQPIISRHYHNTKIHADGEFLTHGSDEWKVTPDRVDFRVVIVTGIRPLRMSMS